MRRTISHLRSRSGWLGSTLFLVLVLAACAPRSTEIAPPNIAYGRDVCDACGMIISDARFAAATLITDGRTLKFDDLGEMFKYHARHPELEVRAWFVHDYNSKNWINGQDAFYVTSKEVKSPMGMGVVAFADNGAAQAFATRLGADVNTFAQVRSMKPSM